MLKFSQYAKLIQVLALLMRNYTVSKKMKNKVFAQLTYIKSYPTLTIYCAINDLNAITQVLIVLNRKIFMILQ